MKLTVYQCKSATGRAKPYKLTDGHGLYLEVMPNGAKYWRYQYSLNGRRPRIALGVFPEIGLAEAREQRDAHRKLVRNGVDPAFERKREKLQSKLNAGNTFECLAREWHETNRARWTAGHASDILMRFERDVFPFLGEMPIADLKPQDVLLTIRQIEARGALELSRRALQNIGRVCRYAIATGRAESDPSHMLWEALERRPKGHFTAISVDELPELVVALRTNPARLFPITRLAMDLMMLTFVRTSELIEATWDEFNLEAGMWVLPAERMKMRRDHMVPLSIQALDVLRQLQETAADRPYVFPHYSRADRHMSNNTILKGLDRLGYKGRMTGHGFRALAMSAIKEKLGYRHEVIDRQLAHQPRSKVDRAYDRAEFLDERRQMMQDWADYIDQCYQEAVLKRD